MITLQEAPPRRVVNWYRVAARVIQGLLCQRGPRDRMMDKPDWSLAPEVNENIIHVEPVNDLIEHEDIDCPCGPDTEIVFREDGSNGWVITHHALDGRA